MKYFYQLLITTHFCTFVISLKYSPIESSYKKGYRAYSDERWSECIAQFEESIHLFKLHKSISNNCRLQCNALSTQTIVKKTIEDLEVYEKYLNRRDCLKKCLDKDKMHMSDVHESIFWNLLEKTPYEYLHICYFQMHAFSKAASAAYTYFTYHPDDEIMKNNLMYYLELPEVDINDVVDLENEEYQTSYNIGVKAYNKSNWTKAAAAMEEVINKYLSWEDSCRAECDRQPVQQVSTDVTITIANLYELLLPCKQKCQNQLKVLNFNSGIDFLAEVLNYLQMSYYHLEKFDKMAEAVETYLLFLPLDEIMLENKKIYSSMVKPESFKTRSDCVYYLNRNKYEQLLLEREEINQNKVYM